MAKRKSATKKPKQADDGQNGGIVSLTKELFQAAIPLRGSVEPADYKRYVLPIMSTSTSSASSRRARGSAAASTSRPSPSSRRSSRCSNRKRASCSIHAAVPAACSCSQISSRSSRVAVVEIRVAKLNVRESPRCLQRPAHTREEAANRRKDDRKVPGFGTDLAQSLRHG